VVVRTIQRGSRCLRCHRAMRRGQSRYRRRVAEVPAQGRVVQLFLHVRRFFGDRRACSQQIFCERVAALAAQSARRTLRLTEALTVVGFALGENRERDSPSNSACRPARIHCCAVYVTLASSQRRASQRWP
jgi:transposase